MAQTLINLAASHRNGGDIATARPLVERALTIREQALGSAHPGVAGALNARQDLLYVSGDYAGARPLYERALAIREAAQGPNHRDVAGVLSDLGLLLAATGDLSGARRAHERAIRIVEQALGPDHIALAWPLNHYGRFLRGGATTGRRAWPRALVRIRNGSRPRSRRLPGSPGPPRGPPEDDRSRIGARALRTSLRIRERTLGPDHSYVAAPLNGLAMLDRRAGRYADARQRYERALRIRERALGPDSPDVASSLNNLGALARVAADYDAAIPYYERALPIVRRVAVPDLRWRVTYGLARCYEQRGRLGRAPPLPGVGRGGRGAGRPVRRRRAASSS